jgi:sugar lactone lactonase YvrE
MNIQLFPFNFSTFMNLSFVSQSKFTKGFCAAAVLFLCAHKSSGMVGPSYAFSTIAGYPGAGGNNGDTTAAQFNKPSGVAIDSSGNLYIADTFNHAIRKITPEGVATTLAGTVGSSGAVDATGPNARFNQPTGIAVDSSGNLYVADSGNNQIRKVTSLGVVTTIAGIAGVSGVQNGPGTNATFSSPQCVARTSAGIIYVADYGNHTIRRINASGNVTTFAGIAGIPGSQDGQGQSAQFDQPQGIALDSAGNLYVTDTANGTIRKITSSGAVSTIAGTAQIFGTNDATGASARFNSPDGIAVDGAGNIYISDYTSQTVRKITSAGVVTTVAGAPGKFGYLNSTNGAARFRGPEGLAVDSAGQLYVVESGNETLRQILISGSVATVTTLAGAASTDAPDGVANNARFFWPHGLALDASGNAYVADTENGTIRKVTTNGVVTTVAGSAGNPGILDGASIGARFFGPQGITVAPDGTMYIADTANSIIRRISGGTVSTLAGLAGVPGSLDGTNSSAQFFEPRAVALDAGGNLFVADTANHVIREVTPDGVVTTIAGQAGYYGGTDATNNRARFHYPSGIAVDASGNIFVSDSFNHTIREITHSDTNWIVTTIAGMSGIWGSSDGMNNAARFYRPQAINVDTHGNLYVTDAGNETLRMISPSGPDWFVSTIAGLVENAGSANGSGTAASFQHPAGVAVASNGSIWLADAGNNTIRLGGMTLGSFLAIITQPQSQIADPGNSVIFTVAAAGAGPLTYQWQFNGTNIGGATSSAYTNSFVQPANAGLYSVVVSNTSHSVLSGSAALIVNTAPFVAVQPQDTAASLGQSSGFTVVAGGTSPFTYQWQFNGVNISSARLPFYNIPSVTSANQGDYTVVIRNSAGMVVSLPGNLAIQTLTAVGDNTFQQLGTPVVVTHTVAIAAGAYHSLALRSDGTIIAWGADSSGQCEVPSTLTNAIAIAAGGFHNLAILPNRTITAWGADDYGQATVPDSLSNVIAVAAGTWHSLALKADGTLVAWGDDSQGQIDIPSDLSGVMGIAAGGSHSLALKSDGTVVAWGDNDDENGAPAGESVVPDGLTHVIRIAAGDYHSLAVLSNGTVVAWGDNSAGQCSVPVLANVVAVAGGGLHSLALQSNGLVVAWGSDYNGQCEIPKVLSDLIGISAGEAHTLVLGNGNLPNPKLLGSVWKDGSFGTILQTVFRKNYAVDFANSLTAPVWTPMGTNSGNGALQFWTDSSANTSKRFYRGRQF